jgi:hypothetical protein
MQAQVQEGIPVSSGQFNQEFLDKENKPLPIEQENRIAVAAAQAAQNLMGSMPPSPEQQQMQMDMQEKMANLQMKKEELNIRKARFEEGVKTNERQQARKDAEVKAKIVEAASRIAKRDK